MSTQAGERVKNAALSKAHLRFAGIGLFFLLMWLSALFKIPMPPDGVPQTLQSLVAILAALGLGARYGALSMALYVLIGALGAPIFAQGNAGIGVLLGQTGGFLFGFIASQPVIAHIVRAKDGRVRGWGAMILAVLVGHLVIFAFGVPWFAIVHQFDLVRAFEGSCLPFIPGMLIKAGVAVWIGRRLVPWASRRIW